MTWYGSASPNPDPARYPAQDGETRPLDTGAAEYAARQQQQPAPRQKSKVDARKLWTGGVATAVVAIGLVIVGFIVIRGLLQMPVLSLRTNGPVPTASVAAYALGAAIASLLATALMHVLLLTTPRPRFFYGWVGALCTAIGVLLPLTVAQTWQARLPTAVLNLVLGIAITAMVSGTAAVSLRNGNRSDYRYDYQR